MGGMKACVECPKYLGLEFPEIDGLYLARVRHIVRLESMINVGCKFRPDDLSPKEWDELIVLSQERGWMRDYLDKRKKKIESNLTPDQEKKLAEARVAAGLPSPGQSLFAARAQKR